MKQRMISESILHTGRLEKMCRKLFHTNIRCIYYLFFITFNKEIFFTRSSPCNTTVLSIHKYTSTHTIYIYVCKHTHTRDLQEFLYLKSFFLYSRNITRTCKPTEPTNYQQPLAYSGLPSRNDFRDMKNIKKKYALTTSVEFLEQCVRLALSQSLKDQLADMGNWSSWSQEGN